MKWTHDHAASVARQLRERDALITALRWLTPLDQVANFALTVQSDRDATVELPADAAPAIRAVLERQLERVEARLKATAGVEIERPMMTGLAT